MAEGEGDELKTVTTNDGAATKLILTYYRNGENFCRINESI